MIDLENQEREIINIMLSQRISWLAAVRIRHKLSLAEVSKMLVVLSTCWASVASVWVSSVRRR